MFFAEFILSRLLRMTLQALEKQLADPDTWVG